ncbi:RNA-binding protein Musashi, partial [Clonorchis sinensis]
RGNESRCSEKACHYSASYATRTLSQVVFQGRLPVVVIQQADGQLSGVNAPTILQQDATSDFAVHGENGPKDITRIDAKTDVGTWFPSNMSFSLHPEKSAQKAFAVLRMIRRTFSPITRMDFQILYGTYVGPHLEYANQVLYSGRTKDVLLIERVQRAATKMVAGLESVDYETRLAVLNLLPLVYCRLRGDVILTYTRFEQGLANRFFAVGPANTRRDMYFREASDQLYLLSSGGTFAVVVTFFRMHYKHLFGLAKLSRGRMHTIRSNQTKPSRTYSTKMVHTSGGSCICLQWPVSMCNAEYETSTKHSSLTRWPTTARDACDHTRRRLPWPLLDSTSQLKHLKHDVRYGAVQKQKGRNYCSRRFEITSNCHTKQNTSRNDKFFTAIREASREAIASHQNTNSAPLVDLEFLPPNYGFGEILGVHVRLGQLLRDIVSVSKHAGSQDSLKSYFSKFGEIEESIVMMDNRTGRSRGFGYIKYKESTSVDSVLAQKLHVVDHKEVDPKRCNINMKGKNRRSLKIFVGGISFEHDESTIRNFFSKYGRVTDVNLLTSPNKQRHRGFAFVGFDDEEVVKNLIRMHFLNLDGKQVEVKAMEPPISQRPNYPISPGGQIHLQANGRAVRGGRTNHFAQIPSNDSFSSVKREVGRCMFVVSAYVNKLARRIIRCQVKVSVGTNREVWWTQDKEVEEAQKAGNA